MANSTLKISFKLEDGANGLKQLTVDAEALRKVMGACTTETEKFKKEVSYLANTSFAIDAVANSLQQLNAYLTDLTDAMAVQQVAETQLAVAMRNSMMATDAQIQAIKDLCSAQQQIGVVGDEVQLAGAQKMATFLKEEESIRKLIPAMNDMLVAQNGLKSTQENAVSVATLFAKAMEGQTTSFKRMGWGLSDAQEKILKYGTEQQKVAVIADLVKSKVGGMNEALAQTESGQIQQKQNIAGDWKEEWGSLAAAIAPTVTLLASATVALGGFLKVTMGIKTAVKAMQALTVGSRAAVTVLHTLGLAAVKNGGFFKTMASSITAARNSTRLLGAALRAALISSGIYVVIQGLSMLFDYFTSSADKATDATGKLADEQARLAEEEDAQARAQNEANTSIQIYISQIKNFSGSKAQEKKLVEELNSTYGETMGYYRDLNGWYVALVKNADDYVELLKEQIKAQRYAKELMELQDKKEAEDPKTKYYSKNEKLTTALREQNKSGKVNGKAVGKADNYVVVVDSRDGSPHVMKTPDWVKIEKRRSAVDVDISNAQAKLDASTARISQLASSVHTGADTPYTSTVASTAKDNTPVFRENAQSPREMKENVRYFQAQFEDAKDFAAQAEANKNIDLWQKKLEAANNAGKAAKVEMGDELIKDPKTIEEMDNNLEFYNKQLQKATSKERAAEINVQKKAVEDLKKSYEEAGLAAEDMAPKLNPEATRLSDIEGNIAFWQKQLDDASVEEAAGINSNIALWEAKARAIRDAGKEVKATFDTYTSGWGAVKGIGSGVDSLTRSLDSDANAWQRVTGIVDGFLQIYEGIKGIIDMINILTDATRTTETATHAAAAAKAVENAVTAEGTAATVADTAASVTNTAAKQGESIANATASGAKLPFPANIAAIAAGIAAVLAAFSMAGGFATGGIVGGSSITGDKLLARVNSGEMILNKDQQRNLFKMLNAPLRTPNITAAGAPRIEFSPDSLFANRREEIRLPRIMGRISGRDIVLAAANETRVASRSGRHSNIKI